MRGLKETVRIAKEHAMNELAAKGSLSDEDKGDIVDALLPYSTEILLRLALEDPSLMERGVKEAKPHAEGWEVIRHALRQYMLDEVNYHLQRNQPFATGQA